jgi:hypothetical protein
MLRPVALLAAVMLNLAGASAYAQSPMKPSAPDEAQKMRDCEKRAAANNIKMDERAKYVMDCMTAKK